MLEDHQLSRHMYLGRMFRKHCFQEHHRQLMEEQDLFPVVQRDDIEHCWRCYSGTEQLLHLTNSYSFYWELTMKKIILFCLKKSKRLVRSDSLEDMSSTLISLLINSIFEKFSNWLLVRTIMIYQYKIYHIKIKLNWI